VSLKPATEPAPRATAGNSIGFLVALPDEARSLGCRRAAFGAVLPLPEGHWLAVSGTGPVAAGAAATRLLGQGAQALVSWGCAAALAPELRPGYLALPATVLGADGTEHPTDVDWRRRLEQSLSPALLTVSGPLLESRSIVAGAADKQSLHAATGAVALDMESAAVARLARSRNLPFLAVRAIADPATMSLPEAVALALDDRGGVHLGKLLGHALRHPAEFVRLARLGRAFGAAVDTLRRARRTAGPDLHYFPLPPTAGGHSPRHR
jgi:adenosylhomocysteine nucleosidase